MTLAATNSWRRARRTLDSLPSFPAAAGRGMSAFHENNSKAHRVQIRKYCVHQVVRRGLARFSEFMYPCCLCELTLSSLLQSTSHPVSLSSISPALVILPRAGMHRAKHSSWQRNLQWLQWRGQGLLTNIITCCGHAWRRLYAGIRLESRLCVAALNWYLEVLSVVWSLKSMPTFFLNSISHLCWI